MHSLPLFVRLNGRKVILLGEGEAAQAKRRLLERAGAVVVGEAEQAALAIVALDAGAEQAVARLRSRGVLVNAVDRSELCDFTLPAIVDRDPVLIAIGTGGASAGLAKALRQRLEAILPASLGQVARALGQARDQLRSRWPDAADRRRAIDAMLAEGAPLDPLVDHGEEDMGAVIGGTRSDDPARLITLIIPSDDPDDLSLRQARLLGQADTVFHQPGIAPAIVDRARADAQRVACHTVPDCPSSGLNLFLVKL